MAKVTRVLRFGDHDRFLRFVQLKSQLEGMAIALGSIWQLKAATEERLRVVAAYEGIPIDRPIAYDAARATVSWEEDAPDPAEVKPEDFKP